MVCAPRPLLEARAGEIRAYAAVREMPFVRAAEPDLTVPAPLNAAVAEAAHAERPFSHDFRGAIAMLSLAAPYPAHWS